MMTARAKPTARSRRATGKRARDRLTLTGLFSRRRSVRFVKGLVGVAVAAGLWEAARAVGILPRRFAPSLGGIAEGLYHSFAGGLPRAIATTMEAWAIGLALATVLGVLLGVCVGLSRWADAATRVIVGFMRPLPSVTLIPVAILIAGLTLTMKLIIVVFAAFWPVFFNVKHGVQSVEPLLVDTGRAMGLGRLEVVRRIILPSALPSMFTGFRVSSAIALIVTIAVELVTGTGGLGQFVLETRLATRVDETYAAIFIGGILGYLVNAASETVENRLLSWNVGYRDAST